MDGGQTGGSGIIHWQGALGRGTWAERGEAAIAGVQTLHEEIGRRCDGVHVRRECTRVGV